MNIKVENKALDRMIQFTGGLPALAHEIGKAVFNFDEDNKIDPFDAISGIEIAADIFGKRYLEPKVIQEIQSEKYRSILGKIATSEEFMYFPPKEEEFHKDDL